MECSMFVFVPICSVYVFGRGVLFRINIVLASPRCGWVFLGGLKIPRAVSDGAASEEDCCCACAMAVPMADIVGLANNVFLRGSPDKTDRVQGESGVGTAGQIFRCYYIMYLGN
jgi:hypothetical protein